jgi:hypothetical protein
MDRREFLIKLSTGTAVVVSGYFVMDSSLKKKTESEPVSSDKPKLDQNVLSSEENEMFTLSYQKTTFYVNKTGHQIISYMDGNNTTVDIARKISKYYSIEYTDLLVTSVVYFISQLGKAALLESPFYATLYENYAQ